MSTIGRASHALSKCLLTFFTVLVLVTLSAGQAITGTLSEATTTTTTSGDCTIRESNYNWTFTDNLGAAHTFRNPTNTHIFESCSSSCNPGRTKSGCFTGCGCPQTGSTSQNEWSTDGLYYLQATAATGKIISAAGYLNPKYKIMGVTYAPPGGNSNSSVSYANTNFVGNTSTNTNSFTKNFTFSISVCGATGDASCGDQGNPGGGMFGFGAGVAITGSESNSWTWAENSANTLTTSKQFMQQQITPGVPAVYNPVNHDYDIVWVWLNPVALFTIVPSGTATTCPGTSTCLFWNGYGYDWADPAHTIDVRPILVGYLNGDFKKSDGTACYATDPTCDPGDASAFSRSWVTTQTFGTGQTAKITSADLPNICGADPFCTNPNYLSTVGLLTGVSPLTTNDQRFSQVGGVTQDFAYTQAGPNSSKGETEVYNQQYVTTTSKSQGGSYTYAQGFGLEEKFNVEFFWQQLSLDIKQNSTLTWMDTWQNTITNTNTQTDIATITGPPCPALTLPCLPAYSEPGEFTVYQDNLYGTFMFWPNPYFSIAVSPATQMVKAGSVTTFQIPTAANVGYSGNLTSFSVSGLPSGVSYGFSPSSGAAGLTSTLTLSTATSTPAGTYPLTIGATDGALTYYACIVGGCPLTGQPYATLVVTAQPSFSLAVSPSSQTIGINAGTSYSVTTTALNGFSGVVSLNVVGLPTNTTASFTPPTITGSGTSTLTLNTTGNTPPGAYSLTFTGTSGSETATATATLVVTGANFTVSATPEIQSITRGSKAVYTVTTTAMSGFSGVITFSLSTLPSGASYTFSPASVTGAGTSTLTINTLTTTPAGDYQLTITGTSGALVQSSQIDLQLN